MFIFNPLKNRSIKGNGLFYLINFLETGIDVRTSIISHEWKSDVDIIFQDIFGKIFLFTIDKRLFCAEIIAWKCHNIAITLFKDVNNIDLSNFRVWQGKVHN